MRRRNNYASSLLIRRLVCGLFLCASQNQAFFDFFSTAASRLCNGGNNYIIAGFFCQTHGAREQEPVCAGGRPGTPKLLLQRSVPDEELYN
jgi:hypothetical protein